MNRFKPAILFIILTICAVGQHFAQGTIRGKVTDGTSGDPLVGATVRILDGSSQIKGGAYTDLEGSYTIKAQPGTYTAIVSYVNYLSDTLPNLTAAQGQVVYNETVLFEEQSSIEVVIEAKRNDASDVAFFTKKKNAINSIDGVTFELTQRTGDNNVAAAMQRVVGVTVEGGKYIYVRGLGDRYSKTTLNGAIIPGLDPDRNTVQLDIFPSNLIDNVEVIKNFTPDLPGDFSGGLVNVITKDFPDRLTVRVSAGAGFNDQASFLNGEFLTYETGGRDWTAFDDGTRALPDFVTEQIEAGNSLAFPPFTASEEVANRAEALTDAFTTSMDPIRGNSTLDQNYQISVGNQYTLNAEKGQAIGFIAGASYRNSFGYRPGRIENRFLLTDSLASQLSATRLLVGDEATHDVLWGALLKLAYKDRNNKVSFTLMRNQALNDRTIFLEGAYADADAIDRTSDNQVRNPTDEIFVENRSIIFSERAIQIYQLAGSHNFSGAKLEWIGSYSPSSLEQPDVRFFDNTFQLQETGSGGFDTTYGFNNSLNVPGRYFRNLDEQILFGKVDFTLPYSVWNDLKAELKVGGLYTYTDRDYAESRYEYTDTDDANPTLNDVDGDLDVFLSDENTGITGTLGNRFLLTSYLSDATLLQNAYTGEQTIIAGYAMTTLPVSDRLKLITGARYEYTDATTTSLDSINFPDPGILRSTADSAGNRQIPSFLPMLSAIYAVQDNMNLRLNAYRTLARPSFREFSPIITFDFGADFQRQGNPRLQGTDIYNVDARWEWFPTFNELVSVSLFYKFFDNPISLVFQPGFNALLTWQNVGTGEAYGAEFEVRKNFGFIGDGWEKLQLNANLSLINTVSDIDSLSLVRIRAADATAEATRPLPGQSPYAVNGELAYIDREKGTTASISYNIFGPRLFLIGAGGTPDAYEQPRGLLNFSISQRFLENRLNVRLRANNLLNPLYRITQTYRFYERDDNGNRVTEGGDFILNERADDYSVYQIGRSFSLSVSYNLNR